MIRVYVTGLVFVGLALLNSADCSAQLTLQVPSVGFFNVDTVVSVPDGGSITLGGVSRSAAGQTSRGVPGLSNIPGLGRGFGNRAIGRQSSAAGVQVKARIIILKEMEKEVLAEAERRRALRANSDPNGTVETQKKADFISRNIGRKR